MIQFNNIQIDYEGRTLLSDFQATIPSGQKCVIVGPSGSGKSTLLGMIAGFVVPDKGEVVLDGIPINAAHLDNVRTKIAWVPQEYFLPYENMNELVDVLFSLKVNRNNKPKREEILEQLSLLGLEESYFTRPFKQLSGGERQRILLVVAVLLKKEVLLLDEPTSALDATSVELVGKYIQSQTATVIAISHDVNFARFFNQVIRIQR